MRVISIANQKGGVGKTTTATNLSAGLAIRGYRTLLVDLDSQANATMTFLSSDMLKLTLADVLVGAADKGLPLNDAIYGSSIDRLDIAAAHIRMAMLDRQTQIDDYYRLKKALRSVEGDYDFAIIDCPPSLGAPLTQALIASTHVLVPVAAQYYPLEGVQDLTDTITNTSELSNSNLQILGYLMTQFDQRNRICTEAVLRIREMFGENMLTTLIRTNVKLQTAPGFRQSIFEFAPESNGSKDYQTLIDEVLEILEVDSPLRIVKEA
jgi:chromosome partitioning protein